jgi:hypothetical protein
MAKQLVFPSAWRSILCHGVREANGPSGCRPGFAIQYREHPVFTFLARVPFVSRWMEREFTTSYTTNIWSVTNGKTEELHLREQ